MIFLMPALVLAMQMRKAGNSTMRCCIAELIVDVPEAEGLALRCENYAAPDALHPDIVIREELYQYEKYPSVYPRSMVAYMESAAQFYGKLLKYGGFYLHCSAVVWEGKAYLFSGDSGVGKSTHTRLWQSTFGPGARVINDDKPALRLIDGVWYAYGTPWCGKDGININEKAPVAGVCFLKQASHNAIRRLNSQEALENILKQTIWKFHNPMILNAVLDHLDRFLKMVPVYELENLPVPDAARLSYETMHRGAEEAGL